MHKFFFSCLGLCNPAEELAVVPVLGGAAPAVAAPVIAPAAAPAVEVETPKPSALDIAKGMVSSNANLIAANRHLTTSNGSLLSENAQLKQQLSASQAQYLTASTQLTELQTALTASETARKDVQIEVTHQLAAAGVPEAALPGTASGSTSDPENLDDIRSAIAAESDPVKKGLLCAKAQKLRESAK